jgi:hypothetical protein
VARPFLFSDASRCGALHALTVLDSVLLFRLLPDTSGLLPIHSQAMLIGNSSASFVSRKERLERTQPPPEGCRGRVTVT